MKNVNEEEKINNLPVKILVVVREGKHFARIVYDNGFCVDTIAGIYRVNCPEIDYWDLYLRGEYKFKDHVVMKPNQESVYKWKERLSRMFIYNHHEQ